MKAAAGLALTDEAFHSTVLVLWRNKLRASDRPQRIFDAIRAVITASGVIATKTRRALDSTVLDDAVARQDTSTHRRQQVAAGGKPPPQRPAGVGPVWTIRGAEIALQISLNNKVRLIVRRAYGFHSADAALALVMLSCRPIELRLPHERAA